MRPFPVVVNGRTPVQVALARVRLPVGARACELAAVATVALFAVVVLAPLTLAHQLPNAYDTDAFYAPFAAFLHDSLAHHHLPLWNPYAFSGQPFAADPQSGVLYPPALLAYGLFVPATGMVVLVTFHYLLATLSSYTLARLVGAGRLGAVYAGLAFGVAGYLLARAQALGLLTGAAWMAASVAAAQYVVRREGRGASPLVLAFALALSILGGSQQLTAVSATAALLMLVLQLRRRGLLLFAGAGVAALGLSAVALLPRLEFVGLSTAAGGVVDSGGTGRLTWSDADLVFGSFGGHAAELAPLYAGALTPALAVLALVRRWHAARIPLVLGLLAIVWSAGLAGWVASPIAPLRSITAHEAVRAMPLLALALAVLAGLALGQPGARPSPWGVAALGVVIALVVSPGVLVHLNYVVPALAGLATLVLLRTPRVPAALACALVPGVLAADLARHDYTEKNPHQPAANWTPATNRFPTAPATARFLLQRQAADGPSRFAWLTDEFTRTKELRFAADPGHRDLLLGMAGTRYGLEDVAGYNPVQLQVYRDAVTSSNGRPISDRHFVWVERAPTSLLRLLGVRYYVAAPGFVPAGMQVVYRTAQATVVRDAKALPLARINRPGQKTVAARMVVRDPDRVVIDTPAGPAGQVVLADPPYPGWHVTVDGKPAKARVQKGLFRAVDVPAGRHQVVWTFDPRSIKLGLILTLATLIGVLAYATAMRRRGFSAAKRRAASGPRRP